MTFFGTDGATKARTASISCLNFFYFNKSLKSYKCRGTRLRKPISSWAGKFSGLSRTRADCWHHLEGAWEVHRMKRKLKGDLKLPSRRLLFCRFVRTWRTRSCRLLIHRFHSPDILDLLKSEKIKNKAGICFEPCDLFTWSPIFLQCCGQHKTEFIAKFHRVNPRINIKN